MNEKHERQLAKARERFTLQKRRRSSYVYDIKEKWVREHRGGYTVGVDESEWDARQSRYGIQRMRLHVGVWEFHIMRKTENYEDYYVGIAVNVHGDIVRGKLTCRATTLLPRVLNDMFKMHKREDKILFTMKGKNTRKIRKDRRRK